MTATFSLTFGLVKVLFVKVSVVALPTKVSVAVGIVNVVEPFGFNEAMTGVVSVLLVNVSVDVSVTIEPSVAIDTLLSVTVVVTPEPPSKINVSPNATASCVELSSCIAVSYTHLTLPTTPYV